MRPTSVLIFLLAFASLVKAEDTRFSTTIIRKFETVCTKANIQFRFVPERFRVIRNNDDDIVITDRNTGQKHYIRFFDNDGAGFSLPEYWEWYISNYGKVLLVRTEAWKKVLSSDAAYDNDLQLHLIYERNEDFFHVILSKPVNIVRNVITTLELQVDVFQDAPCK
jgi:hypothetical protein